ncbi:MAG: hypothetical protein KY434_10065, partial [Actinobacteria bacterium]|nr:hypothetical protein [Actinomycetota bacterium]
MHQERCRIATAADSRQSLVLSQPRRRHRIGGRCSPSDIARVPNAAQRLRRVRAWRHGEMNRITPWLWFDTQAEE